MAGRVRAMKDGGATNADETVRDAVAELLALKANLQALRDAAEAATPAAAAAAAAERRGG
jgi:Arc/MetJ-type ribon-helix-helix transcriptional regulator